MLSNLSTNASFLFIKEVSGVYTSRFLGTSYLKKALRARKNCRGFRETGFSEVIPQIALSSKAKVPNRNKTNSSNKPHSTFVCFDGRKTREERKIGLKVRLFGFPDMIVTDPASTQIQMFNCGLLNVTCETPDLEQ